MSDSPVATGKSLDHVEVLIGLGEGPIKGLATGDLKSFYFGDTPVMNQDGSLVFANTTIEVYPGDANPDPIHLLLGGQANSTVVGVLLASQVPVTRTTSGGILTALDVRIVAQNVQTSEAKEASVSFSIEYKRSTSPTWSSWRSETIRGVFQQKVFEYRIAVDPTELGETYDIRITKQSPDSDSKTYWDIQWESFQEIVAGDKAFPNTAMVRINSQVSNQFSSLPRFSGVYDGYLCRVPSNFDPIAHTFTGVWDGTFKVEWTNDPVWILYEIVMNTTWGLNRYYPCVIDKFDCYTASSQVTSVLVDDGAGGLQPRYTFNRAIANPVDAMELLNLVAGSFNARCVDDQNGTIMLLVDKQDDAVKLFTPEMVENGLFNYQYTDLNQRYNRITLKFPNPELDWEEDRRVIWNQDSIDDIGEIPLDYLMEDCTNAREAMRRGYFRIMGAITEKEQVSFRTNRMGCTVQVFEPILVADPDMGYGITRRIASRDVDGDGHDQIHFDEPIPLEAGLNYTVNFQTPTGLVSVTRYIQFTQSYTSLNFLDPLPSSIQAPIAFSVGNEYGDAGLPKPYRVLSITEVEGDSDKVDVLAIEINRNKYDAADNATFADGYDYSNRKVSNSVDPPSNFTYSMQPRTEGGITRNYLTIGWSDSDDIHFSRYRVEYEYNGGNAQLLTETVNDTALFVDPPPGVYQFYIYAMNTLSFASPALIGVVPVGAAAVPAPSPITGLEIAGQGGDNIFTTLDVMFNWRLSSSASDETLALDGSGAANRDSTFRDYLLTFYDTLTGKEFLQDTTRDTFYNLGYDSNFRSAGGPHRYITLYVQYRDIYGRVSSPAVIRVLNPAPPAVTNLGKAPDGPGLIQIVWDPSPEPDIAGYLLFLSDEEGFEPGPSNRRYDGKDNKYIYSREAASPIYVRVAAYDAFDKTTYTLSDEIMLTVPFIGVDFFGQDTIPREKLTADVQADIARALTGLATFEDLNPTEQLKTLSESIIQIATNLLNLDTRVREAGIETDPVTGATQIYSVAHLNETSTSQAQALSLIGSVASENAKVTRSATAPSDPAVGDLWSNANNDLVYRWDGSAWNYFGGLSGTVYTHSEQITVLQSTIDDPTTGVVATAVALDSLTTTVTTQGTTISSQAAAITALQSTVNDGSTGVVATATALSSLTTTVTSQGTSISSNSTAITALQNTVNNGSTGVVATATALSSLTTTVTSQGTSISSNSTAITALENTVNHATTGVAATASALAGLTSTVSSQGTSISSNSSAITALQNTVNHGTHGNTALSTALTSLTSTVTAQGTSISSNSSAITLLQNTVNHASTGVAALNTSLSSLSSTVTTQGSTITSQGSSITALQGSVNHGTSGNAALYSSYTSLSGTVTSQGGTLSSHAASLTTLNTQVGNINASGYLSIQLASTPAGAYSRVALAATASAGGSPYSAGIFIDAMTSGVSRVVIIANQFYISDTSNLYNPFYFSGGTLYVDNAVITNLQATNIATTAIKDYHITDDHVTNSKLGTDSVTTGKIINNAVSNTVATTAGSTYISSSNTWTTVATISITTFGGKILVGFNDYITWNTNGPRGWYQIVNEYGTQIAYVGYGGGSCPDFICTSGRGVDDTVGAGAHTYYLQAYWTAGNNPTCASPRMDATELKK